MDKNKIALITCWYGPYPWYFPYFTYTIGFSPTVDFIIVTDNSEEIPNKPDNLKIVYRTVDELKDDFSSKLGFVVNIDSPYKLCDFKPAYGFLFQDLINGYDFWGHIDLDITFGDVRGFMTDELLQSYDVISSRHDYTAGCFSLRWAKSKALPCKFYCIVECKDLFHQQRTISITQESKIVR